MFGNIKRGVVFLFKKLKLKNRLSCVWVHTHMIPFATETIFMIVLQIEIVIVQNRAEPR